MFQALGTAATSFLFLELSIIELKKLKKGGSDKLIKKAKKDLASDVKKRKDKKKKLLEQQHKKMRVIMRNKAKGIIAKTYNKEFPCFPASQRRA